jgi:hypothetical protein
VNAVRTGLIAPFFAASGLLAVSGLAKLRHPGSASRALGALRFPSGPLTVRVIGLVEVAIGTWCLFAPGRAAAVSLGLLYGAFAVFLAVLIRAGGASCGCLGRKEVPPSVAHIVLNVAAASVGAIVAFAPPTGVIVFGTRLPLGGLSFFVGTFLIAYLAYLSAAHLPGVFWSYGRPDRLGPRGAAQHFGIGGGSEG